VVTILGFSMLREMSPKIVLFDIIVMPTLVANLA